MEGGETLEERGEERVEDKRDNPQRLSQRALGAQIGAQVEVFLHLLTGDHKRPISFPAQRTELAAACRRLSVERGWRQIVEQSSRCLVDDSLMKNGGLAATQ